MGTPLASSSIDTPVQPAQLFAGSAPVITNRAEGGAEVELAAYTVIAIVADKIVAWVQGGTGGTEVAAGILAAPLNTKATGGNPGSWAPYYTGGDFNHAALVWPVAADTLAERRAAFAQTGTIKISTVL